MKRVINILLVEDDSLDQEEVKRALEKRNILCNLRIVNNGIDATRLVGEGDDESRPDIILLDLNMPKMDGFEVLANIRKNPVCKDVRVFILTTSEDQKDKTKAEALGISGFIVKPLKLERSSSIDAFNLMIDLMNMS